VVVNGVPDSCLVCTVSADWAHFRRIDRTVTKQTYRLPPRTTIAGLLAAIVGVGRDKYYELFDPAVSAIGVEVVGGLRTMTQPSLGLGTNPDETFDSAGGSGKKTVKVSFPDSTDNRQIHSYEYVVDPAYRLYVAVEDDDFHAALKHHLECGTSYYPPSLGLSELLARVETPESSVEHEVTPVSVDDSTVAADSAIPEAVETVIPREGAPHHVERLPAAMEADGRNRQTTEYVDYAFTADGKPLETTGDGLALGEVAGRTVAFY
jgi:CRISPR-associated protein Cas5h